MFIFLNYLLFLSKTSSSSNELIRVLCTKPSGCLISGNIFPCHFLKLVCYHSAVSFVVFSNSITSTETMKFGKFWAPVLPQSTKYRSTKLVLFFSLSLVTKNQVPKSTSMLRKRTSPCRVERLRLGSHSSYYFTVTEDSRT